MKKVKQVLMKINLFIVIRSDEVRWFSESIHFNFSVRSDKTCGELSLSGCFRICFPDMKKSLPVVKVPVPAFQCDLVVFPLPLGYQEKSKFYVLQSKEEIDLDKVGFLDVEYILGMVYCFLPSLEKRKGQLSMFESKPRFIDSYTTCFEVSNKFLLTYI